MGVGLLPLAVAGPGGEPLVRKMEPFLVFSRGKEMQICPLVIL